MAQVDDGVAPFRTHVSRILRLRTSRASAELEHHVIDRVGPGVSNQRTDSLAESLVNGKLSGVVAAEAVRCKVAHAGEIRCHRVVWTPCIQRCRSGYRLISVPGVIKASSKISDRCCPNHQRPGRDLVLECQIELLRV